MLLLKRFSTLQWKLALSYVGVTLLTVLTLEIIVVLILNGFGGWIGSVWARHTALNQAEALAEQIAEPLENGDLDQVAQVLNQPVGLVVNIHIGEDVVTDAQTDQAYVLVDPAGDIIASNHAEQYPSGDLFADPGWPAGEALLSEALISEATASYLLEDPATFLAAVPIKGRHGARLGTLYYRQPTFDITEGVLRPFWSPLVTTSLVLLPFIIPLGLVFGFVTAAGFTKRLHRLTQASNDLAQGDLSRRVADDSDDEIGQLAGQFNVMATQIEADTQRLRALAERNARLAKQTQKLAALEERHRLARDLHDGVKQHLFGVNLAAAAALNLLETDLPLAHTRLVEVKEHSLKAQAEMDALLNELRPAGLDNRGLSAALEDHLAAFERQYGIDVDWQATVNEPLPLVYQQALYRISQEALSNIARHAHATQVTVRLNATPEAITLQIADNGQGFDPDIVVTGNTRGLRGMRERLAGLGGTLKIDAAPGQGTRLSAQLPAKPAP